MPLAPPLPCIEVICVAYRRYGPLKILVQSFLNQTSGNWKLTVCHDGPDVEFDRVMREFAAGGDQRISYAHTPQRYNDWGHSLRAEGLRRATGDYVLLTNDDNYYVPRFAEFVTEAILAHAPDVVHFDMIHSHDRPGGRPQPAYSYFPTVFKRLNLDIGAAVVRGDLARAAGFRDRTHDGDATYFEDVQRMAGRPLNICKLNRVLFVHN